ncbi:DegT/DnrJ/EryC1/StrS family aminotransferase [Streptomyces sp. CNQ085]|uniref:DegT/DnrJ/EryC1/StrS family aminotransferase n=1 Tax=Streptomyces sp. CNQ085 TaxID=2886944 RepID=UPI001F50802A|nr:DegT/DnrJ/EryC1/StrS family aminotransferase [Streptomyces sp. CNQ085]MCI0385353.1 DegT/DnrJ/EryC1/StrS family aminotransferase [Streptomyces sp. CNQ085]
MGTMTPSGALRTGLEKQGIGIGDEVIVPAYCDSEVAAAVRETGALPVFADIDPGSLCIDPTSVAEAVNERTAAVIPVHLFGHPADMVCLHALAQHHGMKVVEPGTPALVSSVETARRRQHADFLSARLTGVIVPRAAAGVRHGYEQYVVRVPGNGRPDRDAFKHALRARGVCCHVPVRTPVHRLPEFRTDVRLPETERAVGECLALPLEASMTRRELQRIVSACNALGGLLMEPAC